MRQTAAGMAGWISPQWQLPFYLNCSVLSILNTLKSGIQKWVSLEKCQTGFPSTGDNKYDGGGYKGVDRSGSPFLFLRIPTFGRKPIPIHVYRGRRYLLSGRRYHGKVDRATMSVALEPESLFLDHKVIEHVLSLPNKCQSRDHQSKWVLRQILAYKNLVPH